MRTSWLFRSINVQRSRSPLQTGIIDVRSALYAVAES